MHDQCEEALKHDGISSDDPQEVQDYVEYIRSQEMMLDDPTLVIEQHVVIKSISEDARGTADVILYEDFGPLHIMDAKFGWQYVSEHGNQQLMYNAPDAIETLHLNPTAVYMHIYQPAHEGEDGSWRTTQVSMQELMKFYGVLERAVFKIEEGDTTRKAGDHCQFCNKAQCPVADEAFKAVTGMSLTETSTVPDLKMFSTERLLQLRDMEKFIKGVFRDASSILMSRAVQGDEVQGFKLVKAVGNRRWKDESILADEIGANTGYSMDIYDKKCMSPAKIKSALKERMKDEGHSKKEVKDMETWLEELTDRPDNGVKLVPEGAPGVPVLPETFNDIEE